MATTSQPKPSTEREGIFDSLRYANYRYLWFGTIFSSTGQWLQQVSLGWVVYDLTGSGTLLGSVNAMRFIAILMFAPFSGVVIDRLDRGKQLTWSPLILFTSSIILAFVLLFDRAEVWHLFIFMFLFGTIQAFENPLRNSLAFELVPREKAPNAISLNWVAQISTRAVAPTFGGMLMSAVGASGNFFVQGGGYLLALLTRLKMKVPARPHRSDRKPLADFLEGITFVARSHRTRSYLLMSFIPTILLVPTFTSLAPIFAKDIYGAGPSALGFMLGAVGVGDLLGAVFTAWLKVDRRGLFQLASLFAFGLAMFLFTLATQLWLGILLLGLAGFFEMATLTTNQTMLQLSVPDRLRTRVSGVMMLSAGVLPLGALAGGIGADVIGAPITARIMASAVLVITVLIFAFSPLIRNGRFSEALASAQTD